MNRPAAMLLHAASLAKLPLAFARELRKCGWRSAWRKAAAFRIQWRPYHYRPDFEPDALRAAAVALQRRPLISVLLPVYNVSPRWLKRAVASVEKQAYTNWELCVVDDASPCATTRACVARLAHARVRTAMLPTNLGISGATNHALSMATGEYVALLDHDDELTEDALYHVARAIAAHEPDVLYSDEDLVAPAGRFLDAHLKPDYASDLLLAHNYITHLLVARRALMEAIGGFRDHFNGAQDYDLLLRLTERAASIAHIRRVLYHWRSIRTSTSRKAGSKPYAADAGRLALTEALARRGIKADVEHGNLPHYYRVRRQLIDRPLVSVVIPFRDRPELLEVCVRAILTRSTYTNLEIIGADNDSAEPRTHAVMDALTTRDARVRFVSIGGPFNYSRINNTAARQAKGAHIVLMNNDIEIITPGWVEALLAHSQRPEVGAVGAKLYYADRRIQHAGIIVGIGGFAGHAHRHLESTRNGYMNRLRVAHNVSAVTAALMMTKRDLFLAAGGLNEANLGTALNDVDFCLRLRERGLLNVFTPECEAVHHESASRGYEDTPEKQRRFETEVAWFQQRHRSVLDQGDPYYNPGLHIHYEDFRYAHEPRRGVDIAVTRLRADGSALPVTQS
jgi:glycosyltransferase involved in cell wall biosynthesis